MTNEEATQFAFNSYITAFEAGNEYLIDQYFSPDLKFHNHSVARNYSLQQIKLSVLNVHKKYQDLKGEIKDVMVEGNRIAFRAEQHAFFVPDDKHVNIDVMNLYTLVDGKVKEWRLWFNQKTLNPPSMKEFDTLISRARKQAKTAKLTKKSLEKVVKKVRRK